MSKHIRYGVGIFLGVISFYFTFWAQSNVVNFLSQYNYWWILPTYLITFITIIGAICFLNLAYWFFTEKSKKENE